MALLCPFLSISQTVRPLNIGDTVPDIELGRLYDYKTNKVSVVKLSDFKDKLIILDFWATWCGPCVKSLLKMSTIQQRNTKDLIVLPATYEKTSVAEAFFKREKRISLPSIVEDTLLNSYFPKRIIPHTVIIDKQRKIISITSPLYITQETINDLLANKPVNLPVKKDVMDFVQGRPLQTETSEHTKNILYRSLITGYQPGLASQVNATFLDSVRVGFQYINVSLLQLLLFAYNKPDWYHYSRIIIEGEDSIRKNLLSPEGISDREIWKRSNLFSYDIIDPFHSRAQQKRIMLNELQILLAGRYGLESSIIYKTVDCWVLTLREGAMVKKSEALSYKSYSSTDQKKNIYHHQTAADLALNLEKALRIPVANGISLNYPIDLELSHEQLSRFLQTKDISYIRNALQHYGLDLKKGMREMEVLLLQKINPNEL